MTYLTSIPRCVWTGHSVLLQAELGPSFRKVGRPPPSPRPRWAVWHPGAEGRGADVAWGSPLGRGEAADLPPSRRAAAPLRHWGHGCRQTLPPSGFGRQVTAG